MRRSCQRQTQVFDLLNNTTDGIGTNEIMRETGSDAEKHPYFSLLSDYAHRVTRPIINKGVSMDDVTSAIQGQRFVHARNTSWWFIICLIFAFIALLYPVAIASNSAQDDALITLRYARNLAEGSGMVYNAGEQVLGTTTPAWALVTSIFFTLGTSDTVAVVLTQLVGTLCLLAAFVTIATRHPALNSRTHAGLFILCIASLPAMRGAAISGMETSLLIFIGAALWTMVCLKTEPKVVLLRVALIVFGLFVRLDFIFFVVALYLATLLVNFDSTRFKPILKQSLVEAVATIVLFGLLWISLIVIPYKALVPQSMIAKSLVNYEGVHLDVGIAAWIKTLASLFNLDFPWPRVLQPILINLSLGLLWTIGMLWGYRSTQHSASRVLYLTAVIYGACYALFLTVGEAGVFPWYGHLAVFVLATSVLAELLPRFRSLLPGFVIATILIFSIFVLALDIRGYFRGEHQTNEPFYRVGVFLRDERATSVMLEPLGYIGYYSHTPTVFDLAGLVSPAIFTYRRSGEPGWFFKAVMSHQPQYVVLREGEVEANLAWNVGVLFASEAQREQWQNDYELLKVVGNANDATGQRAIYRRK